MADENEKKAAGKEEEPKRKLRNISKEELEGILAEHVKWFGSDGVRGTWADLNGADIVKTDLRDAWLKNAELRDANLEGADLRGADLSGADLSGADLSGADLRGAELSGAELSGADLSGAMLLNARFQGAILRGTELGSTDLAGVHGLTKEQVGEAFVDKTTQLPEYLDFLRVTDLPPSVEREERSQNVESENTQASETEGTVDKGFNADKFTEDFKILVADDEKSLIEVVSKTLKKEGYIVFTATNGGAVLEIVENETIDLVVLDNRMPGLSCEEILDGIRNVSNDIVVIIISDFADKPWLDSILERGAIDYILKPFSLNDLLHRVNFALKLIQLNRKAKALQNMLNSLGHDNKAETFIRDLKQFDVLVSGGLNENTNTLIEIKTNQLIDLETQINNYINIAKVKIENKDLKEDERITPTPKVDSDKWVKEDSLGYEIYARALAELITHEDTKPPLTIGIKAPWGAGKTSLMKNIQHMLDGYAHLTEENTATEHGQGPKLTINELLEGLKEPFKGEGNLQPEKGKEPGISPRATVWFNAWKYQTSEQIWAGLAHSIISQVTARMCAADKERFWLNLHARRIDTAKIRFNAYKLVFSEFLPWALFWAIAMIIVLFLDILPKWLGIVLPVVGVIHYLIKKESKFTEKVSGVLREAISAPDYKGRTGFLHLVETDMKAVLKLVATPEQPLVIFIDDLDRCSPNRVAEVVEAVNLFLSGDYSNCIFVIGMEPAMVASAIEVANKDVIEKINGHTLLNNHTPLGWRFMEKIVQLPIVIPAPTESGVESYLNRLVGRLEEDNEQIASMDKSDEPKQEDVNKFAAILNSAQSADDVSKISDELFEKASEVEKSAIAEAAKQKYTEKFTNRDPALREFVDTAIPFFHNNPRQIKRYTNLFRFLCTVREFVKIEGKEKGTEIPEMPSDSVLSKYVVLCALWPLALDCINEREEVSQSDEVKSVSLFSKLEEKARSLDKERVMNADDEWKKYIDKYFANSGGWLHSGEFRRFLASGEPIAKFEGCGLW